MVLNLTDMCDFHPLEVVGRGSETQLRVGEKLNKMAGKGLRRQVRNKVYSGRR